MSKQHKAILFDWDGTLARTLDIWVDEIQIELKSSYGIEHSRKRIGAELGNEDFSSNLGAPKADAEIIWNAIEPRALMRLKAVPLYDHAKDTLQALRGYDIKMALVSSSTRLSLTTALQVHGLESFFDAVVSCDDVRNLKPDPEPFLLALKNMDVPVARAIVVGDTEKDLAAAQAMGMSAYLHFPELHMDFYDLEHYKSFNPKHIFTDWSQLEAELIRDGFL